MPLALFGRCTVCERRSVFVMRRPIGNRLRALRCRRCGSPGRSRHVAKVATEALGLASLHELRARSDLRVLNTNSGTGIAAQLDGLDHVHNTGFWDDVEPGGHRGGVRCEDLTALTYPDRMFRLVITEDVLEHVPDHRQALSEIRRVLVPGGHHVFSIPFQPGRRSVHPFDLRDGRVVLHEPAKFHADPIRGRIPVFHEFGHDLFDELRDAGFVTRLVLSQYVDQRRHGIVDCMSFVSRRT